MGVGNRTSIASHSHPIGKGGDLRSSSMMGKRAPLARSEASAARPCLPAALSARELVCVPRAGRCETAMFGGEVLRIYVPLNDEADRCPAEITHLQRGYRQDHGQQNGPEAVVAIRETDNKSSGRSNNERPGKNRSREAQTKHCADQYGRHCEHRHHCKSAVKMFAGEIAVGD